MKHYMWLFLTLLLFGCESAPIPGVHVLLPNVPIEIRGAKVLPPQDGEDWYFQRYENHTVLHFTKAGKFDYESVVAQVALFQLTSFQTEEELLRIVSEGRKMDTDPDRFSIVRNKETVTQTIKAGLCINYESLIEDASPASVDKKMLLNISGFICPHPKNSSIGVDISYSARYFPSNASHYFDVDITAESVHFLNNVSFTGF